MGPGPKKELARFLAEDIGRGDISSALLSKKKISARIIAKEDCIISGARHAQQIFQIKGCSAKIITSDGKKAKNGKTVLSVSGPPQGVLSCERTALNLLSRMSGIATLTNQLVQKVPKSVGVFATRKTAPGLRFFDKEAVRTGGGKKHRMALDESVMLKDNHIAAGGPIEVLLKKAKKKHRRVEIEVESQKDAVLAARLGADIIMLDNFTPARIIRTVAVLKKEGLRRQVLLEASGRISSKNIKKFAKTGVDMISVGAITSSPAGIDFSLEVN